MMGFLALLGLLLVEDSKSSLVRVFQTLAELGLELFKLDLYFLSLDKFNIDAQFGGERRARGG